MEHRLVELETKLAFQEDTIQKLNDVATLQQKQIDRLSRELEEIKSHLREIMPSLVSSEKEEKPPPHY